MKILAKLYNYNANTSNKNTGDCVARSISLAEDNGSSDYSYRYSVSLNALPEDPYSKSRGSWVTCYGDNLRELVDGLKSYFNDYQRYGYDF